MWVPALRRTANALHRVRDKSRPYFRTQITRTTRFRIARSAGLPQCLGRVLRLLQRGTDRHRRHRFRLGPICAWACEAAKPEAAIINVAESTDLMTNPGECRSEIGERVIDVPRIKHICLVGNNRAPVQRGY